MRSEKERLQCLINMIGGFANFDNIIAVLGPLLKDRAKSESVVSIGEMVCSGVSSLLFGAYYFMKDSSWSSPKEWLSLVMISNITSIVGGGLVVSSTEDCDMMNTQTLIGFGLIVFSKLAHPVLTHVIDSEHKIQSPAQ